MDSFLISDLATFAYVTVLFSEQETLSHGTSPYEFASCPVVATFVHIWATSLNVPQGACDALDCKSV